MNELDFIAKYGNESQEVTRNFTTKSLGTNYHIKDAFIEFGDNAYDARFSNENINFDICYDENNHTLTFTDNGTGICDDTNLFKLGGTNKENKRSIGKFGIGVPGATAAIATQCVFDNKEMVEVIFESSCEGKKFIKHIAFMPNGDMYIGTTQYFNCDMSFHYTKIQFNNVILKNYPDIIDAIENTFEEPLLKNMNISFNNRQLGKAITKTFVGDEVVKTIMVGEYPVDVKYRIIGGETNSAVRSFDEAGLRIYDKESGRLLAKSTNYWAWFAGKKAQQNICGLRAAIYIPSSIGSYNKFRITPAKNGVTYKEFHKTDSDFAELSSELATIYIQAANNTPSNNDGTIVIGGKTFQATTGKLDNLYISVNDSVILYKRKPTQNDIAQLIYENIMLKNKLERKSNKTKNA